MKIKKKGEKFPLNFPNSSSYCLLRLREEIFVFECVKQTKKATMMEERKRYKFKIKKKMSCVMLLNREIPLNMMAKK